MKIALVLLTAIVAGALVLLISRQFARLTNRIVVILAVVALGLYGAFLALAPDNWILINVVVLGVAGIGGSGLGLFMASRVSLVTFCIVASVIDIYSATQGPTSSLVDSYREGGSDLLRYLSVSMPIEGNVRPVVGIGDFLIIAAICFALSRMRYEPLPTLMAPLSGLLIAIIVGVLVGGIFAIPFIAATTILFLSLVRPA